MSSAKMALQVYRKNMKRARQGGHHE